MDTYQGKIGTVSPAMGPYQMQVYVNIDQEGATGASGVTGMNTQVPYDWQIGVTGIDSANFKNATHGF